MKRVLKISIDFYNKDQEKEKNSVKTEFFLKIKIIKRAKNESKM
jgi:hypothetical protein